MSKFRNSGRTFESDDERIEVRVADDGTVIITDSIQNESVHMPAELWDLIIASVESCGHR